MENNKSARTQQNPTGWAFPHGQVHIRARPGVYIGDTGSNGLRYIVLELIDRCVEEADAGHATLVAVELLADDGCRVRDDGEGIPVHFVEPGVRFLERAMTSFFNGEYER